MRKGHEIVIQAVVLKVWPRQAAAVSAGHLLNMQFLKLTDSENLRVVPRKLSVHMSCR